MHLYIDNYGVCINVEAEMFKISSEDEERLISPLKISSLNLMRQGSITSAALILAAQNQIPVIIYNKKGKAEACLWGTQYQNIADLRVRQAFFSQHPQSLIWMQSVLKMKVEAQINNLKWLKNRIYAKSITLQNSVDFLQRQKENNIHTESVEQLRAWEGQCSKLYWQAIIDSMNHYIIIPGRVKKGATDPFNMSLNYLYGIMYNNVEASLLMVGLDPYMGLMHINRHKKPALAFDHIEPFRPWVDKLLLQLFMHDFFSEQNFGISEDNSYILSSEAKKILIHNYLTFMEERSYLNGKRIKNKDHIHHLSGQLINVLKNFVLP